MKDMSAWMMPLFGGAGLMYYVLQSLKKEKMTVTDKTKAWGDRIFAAVGEVLVLLGEEMGKLRRQAESAAESNLKLYKEANEAETKRRALEEKLSAAEARHRDCQSELESMRSGSFVLDATAIAAHWKGEPPTFTLPRGWTWFEVKMEPMKVAVYVPVPVRAAAEAAQLMNKAYVPGQR